MAVLFGSTSRTEAQLRRMLRENQEGLDALSQRLTDPAFPAVEPLGIFTAVELLGSVSKLVRAARKGPVDKAQLIRLVNVQYDAMIAALDLMKVHSTLSRVPRGPRRAPKRARRSTRRRRPSRAGSAG